MKTPPSPRLTAVCALVALSVVGARAEGLKLTRELIVPPAALTGTRYWMPALAVQNGLL